MIRIRPGRRLHISNRFALVGALTLALTMWTGVDQSEKNVSGDMASARQNMTQPVDPVDGDDPAEHGKRFSISRLLFGHG